MPQQAAIKSAIQLLVEGNDQRNFFEAFTSHLSISNVQIQNFSVGVAAKNDYWDLDHSVFSTVRDFLQMIAPTDSK